MIINIPTIVEELKENATEEQRCGLNILESRFYECINLNKKLEIATKALEKINNPTIGDIYNKSTDEIDYNLIMDIAQQALKEMEEV